VDNAGAGLADVLKGFVPQSVSQILGFVTPVVGAVEDMKKSADVLADIAHGKSIEEAERAHRPEAFALADAEKTAPFSRERFAAGFGTVAQLGMAAGIARGIARGIAPRPSLTETLFSKPEEIAAPVVPPIEQALPKGIPELLRRPEELPAEPVQPRAEAGPAATAATEAKASESPTSTTEPATAPKPEEVVQPEPEPKIGNPEAPADAESNVSVGDTIRRERSATR
jgi:hypothetical protein